MAWEKAVDKQGLSEVLAGYVTSERQEAFDRRAAQSAQSPRG
jgi:hypothetical protein